MKKNNNVIKDANDMIHKYHFTPEDVRAYTKFVTSGVLTALGLGIFYGIQLHRTYITWKKMREKEERMKRELQGKREE